MISRTTTMAALSVLVLLCSPASAMLVQNHALARSEAHSSLPNKILVSMNRLDVEEGGPINLFLTEMGYCPCTIPHLFDQMTLQGVDADGKATWQGGNVLDYVTAQVGEDGSLTDTWVSLSPDNQDLACQLSVSHDNGKWVYQESTGVPLFTTVGDKKPAQSDGGAAFGIYDVSSVDEYEFMQMAQAIQCGGEIPDTRYWQNINITPGFGGAEPATHRPMTALTDTVLTLATRDAGYPGHPAKHTSNEQAKCVQITGCDQM